LQNHYFTLTSPFRDLFRWLQEYLEVFPPPGFPTVRAGGEPPLLHEDGVTRSLGVRFYGLQPDGSDVLLFEVVAQEAHGSCGLRLRCHELSLAGWFWMLLERLAPGRASNEAQPLPERPGRLFASALLPPAPAAAGTPAASAEASPPAASPLEQAEPLRPAQPSASSSQSTRRQHRKRGPKGHSLAERDQACEEYWQGQPDVKQFMIAAKYDISPRQFQRWWDDYAKRHGLT
jgi:hypothetical protein